MTKERLRELLEISVHELFAIEVDEASPQELFQALANVVKQMYSEDWRQTRKKSLAGGSKTSVLFFNRIFAWQNAKKQFVEYAAVGASGSRF